MGHCSPWCPQPITGPRLIKRQSQSQSSSSSNEKESSTTATGSPIVQLRVQSPTPIQSSKDNKSAAGIGHRLRLLSSAGSASPSPSPSPASTPVKPPPLSSAPSSSGQSRTAATTDTPVSGPSSSSLRNAEDVRSPTYSRDQRDSQDRAPRRDHQHRHKPSINTSTPPSRDDAVTSTSAAMKGFDNIRVPDSAGNIAAAKHQGEKVNKLQKHQHFAPPSSGSGESRASNKLIPPQPSNGGGGGMNVSTTPSSGHARSPTSNSSTPKSPILQSPQLDAIGRRSSQDRPARTREEDQLIRSSWKASPIPQSVASSSSSAAPPSFSSSSRAHSPLPPTSTSTPTPLLSPSPNMRLANLPSLSSSSSSKGKESSKANTPYTQSPMHASTSSSSSPLLGQGTSSSSASAAASSEDPSKQYKLLEKIGHGSFGTVYRALHLSSNTMVAIKQIDLEDSDDDIMEIQAEIAHLSACDSDFVTRYYGSFVRGYKLWIGEFTLSFLLHNYSV